MFIETRRSCVCISYVCISFLFVLCALCEKEGGNAAAQAQLELVQYSQLYLL